MDNQRKEKVFLGKVTSRETQYGPLIKIALGMRDVETINKNMNVQGWSNWTLKSNPAGVQYLELDTWHPDVMNDKLPTDTDDLDF